MTPALVTGMLTFTSMYEMGVTVGVSKVMAGCWKRGDPTLEAAIGAEATNVILSPPISTRSVYTSLFSVSWIRGLPSAVEPNKPVNPNTLSNPISSSHMVLLTQVSVDEGYR